MDHVVETKSSEISTKKRAPSLPCVNPFSLVISLVRLASALSTRRQTGAILIV